METMYFLWVLLWMAIVAVLLCNLLVWTYPHYLLRYEFPFAICQRIIARLTENTVFMALRLDYTAWKMGLCNHHTMTRFLFKGFPIFKQDPKLHITQSRFDGVPVKLCQPRGDHTKHQRGILFFHGGIGIWNVINIYERVCRYLARESASFVVSVEYRLAPEHPYPAQFEDCLKATIHLLKNAKEYGVDPDCIVISGDSSGATLAAAVCQELVKRTDLPKVRAQILLHPFLQAERPEYQGQRILNGIRLQGAPKSHQRPHLLASFCTAIHHLLVHHIHRKKETPEFQGQRLFHGMHLQGAPKSHQCPHLLASFCTAVHHLLVHRIHRLECMFLGAG